MSNDIIHCQNTQYMNEGGAGFVITKVLSFSCVVSELERLGLLGRFRTLQGI